MQYNGKEIKIGDFISFVEGPCRGDGVVCAFDGTGHPLLELDFSRIPAGTPRIAGWPVGVMNEDFIVPKRSFKCQPGALYWWVLSPNMILGHSLSHKKMDPPALRCRECQEPNSYAEPNQKDGKFLCWSCKDTYRWKYSD